MPDDTTEARAREFFARELDRDGEEVAALLWRGSGPAHPDSVNGRIVRAMLAYAATVRREMREECARVCGDFAAGQRERKIGPGGGVLDGTLENEAFVADHLAAAIRQLGFSGGSEPQPDSGRG